MFFVIPTSLNPNFAIVLFSSTNGTISDIVPIHTISKYFKYSFGSSPNFIDIACISLNTTPTPAKPLNGYVLSFRFGFIIQYAFGKFSACSWWSVIIVSIPNAFAKSTSSIPDIPQSTVIIRL